MSHFTRMKTEICNLFYLKKALDRLSINYTLSQGKSQEINLIIPQTNGYNVEFIWNGQEYALVADLHFWEQSDCASNFIGKISQQYVNEVIVGESQKNGFQPVKYQKNLDNSNKLVLERWS